MKVNFKTILSVFLISICGNLFSQYTEYKYYDNISTLKTRVEKLKTTKLLVAVYDKESELGKTIIDAFTKYWTFTKFDFITTGEIEKYVDDEQYAILTFVNFQKYYESMDHFGKPTGAGFSTRARVGYGIYLCGKKAGAFSKQVSHSNAEYSVMKNGKEKSQDLPAGMYCAQFSEVSSPEPNMSLNGIKVPATEKEYSQLQLQEISTPYTPFIIARMQKNLELAINSVVFDPLVFSNPKKDSTEIKAVTSKLKDKTIYLYNDIADSMSIDLFLQILKIAKENIKIVSLKEIQKAYEAKDRNVYFVFDALMGSGYLNSIDGELTALAGNMLFVKDTSIRIQYETMLKKSKGKEKKKSAH